MISYFPLRSVFTNIYVCIFFFGLIFTLSLRNFLFDILFLGMSRALLESVRIPCSKSTTKEWYNVVLLEKLLHILYSACQYGLFQKIILFQSLQSTYVDSYLKKKVVHIWFNFKTNMALYLWKIYKNSMKLILQ